MTDANPENQRTRYRLRYPLSACPKLVTEQRYFIVTEVSESGLRLLGVSEYSFSTGDLVQGQLEFPEGSPVAVTGHVVRFEPEEVVVQLDEGVPFSVMVREQRSLSRRGLAFDSRAGTTEGSDPVSEDDGETESDGA